MDEIRDFLLSPQEYLDTFWESDVLIWIDWREYDESIIKYINEKPVSYTHLTLPTILLV